jgi:hypothetical protein
MKKMKLWLITLAMININYAIIQAKSNAPIKNFIRAISKHVIRHTRSTADWTKYYKHVCTYHLADWLEYYYCTIKDDTERFTEFIQNENDKIFKKLSKIEQQAIKDLNVFYKSMAGVSKEKQATLSQAFAARWDECQEIFNKMKHKNH